MRIKGYRRPDNSFGIRNHLLILPTSVCAADTAARIASNIPGAIALPNQNGCCQVGEDYKQAIRVLAGFGKNANVGAALVVGLGCEGIQARDLVKEIRATGKACESIIIQENSGTLTTISKGTEIASRLAKELSQQQVTSASVSELVLGLECGGSDPTSGLASNPIIGYVSDRLVNEGGISILSETTEVIGAEHLLAKRFRSDEEKNKFLNFVWDCEERSKKLGVDLREGQPTPGNKEGGLSTIEEKSLGCMYKAGTSPFAGALDYAELINHETRGLYFMDTPGQDIDSITGMVAGGATVIIFSTGRGTPTGCPIAPVIKITGNQKTYENMQDNIDINGGRIITGESTLDELGQETYDFMVKVANGELTKAEILGHREFGMYKIAPTF